MTLYLIVHTLLKSENGKEAPDTGMIGFQKVLAAPPSPDRNPDHVRYMFAYVNYRLPELEDVNMGRVVSISFLILNAIRSDPAGYHPEPLDHFKVG